MESQRRNPNSLAREFVVQFLYQCEREKIGYFPEANFRNFLNHFDVPADARAYARVLAEGVLENLLQLDEHLSKVAKNWSVSRMGSVDRCVLRMAGYELSQKKVPRKVAINEAVDLAKKFGSENSGSFVNGILDKFSSSAENEANQGGESGLSIGDRSGDHG